jgi:PAS domain S-box-containing protein
MRHISMENKILGVFLLMAVGLLTSTALVFITTRRLIDTADWVSHTYAVIGRIEAARAATIEAQTAIYRYIIDGQGAFLDKEGLALGKLETDYIQLRRMTSDNPIERQHLDQLNEALTAWKLRVGNIQLVMQAKGFGAVQALVNRHYIGSSTTLFPILDAMHGEEQSLLGSRLKEEHRRAYMVNVVYVIFCLLAVSLFIGLYFQIRREIIERRQSERKFQTLFDTAADAIIVSDFSGKIIMANERVKELLGYAKPEIIGLSVDALVPEQDRDQHRHHRGNYIAAPQTRHMGQGLQLFALNKNGSKMPVDINLSTFPIDGKLAVVSRVRDMTEHRNTQEKIRELNQHLVERASELENVNKELEAFSYSVSHDLRAPLRAVDGFTNLLEEHCRGHLDDEAMRLLRVVRDNSKKMGNLIDDLLKFSRLGRKPTQKRSFNMGELVEEVLSELATETQKVTIKIVALPDVRADRALLKQVWINVLSNAIKYSANVAEPTIAVEGQRVDREVVYCVCDNGVGFDMRYAHKLFTVFQRLHGADEFPGTGVGLATVKRIVVKHGGRVWADSKPGNGAKFYFSLPMYG